MTYDSPRYGRNEEEISDELDEAIAVAKDSMTARRVYADPVERNGTTVIAAAAVSGAGGGGTEESGKHGTGGSFGLNGKPIGAFVVTDNRVSWRPTVDINGLFTVLGAVTIVALIVMTRSRGRAAR